MEELPVDLWMRIFYMLDYRHLANAALVCRCWSYQSGQAQLWKRLYEQRWGEETPDPGKFKSWKAAYEAQDRCERVGKDICITREGLDYFLVHEGRPLQFLGSRQSFQYYLDENKYRMEGKAKVHIPALLPKEEHERQKHVVSQRGLVDKLLFFLGDLDHASRKSKRSRLH